MRVLGIDYGSKRIGLAISDESETIANAISPLDNQGEDEVVAAVAKVVRDKEIAKVVVGLPVSLAGGEEWQAKIVKQFAVDLEERIKQKIDFVDERLTTSQARAILGEHAKKVSLDSSSAQIILQSYLDANKDKSDD